MALNPGPVGSAIASFIESQEPAPGVENHPSNVTAIWQGIMNLIYNDIKANAQVEPGSFSNSAGPVGGVGTIQ
jgi:hypothetical protein